jgi:uncharacterized membrane protein
LFSAAVSAAASICCYEVMESAIANHGAVAVALTEVDVEGSSYCCYWSMMILMMILILILILIHSNDGAQRSKAVTHRRRHGQNLARRTCNTSMEW